MEHLDEIQATYSDSTTLSFRSFSIFIYGCLRNNKTKAREKGQQKGAGVLNSILSYPLPLPFPLLLTFLLPQNQNIFILYQNIYLTYSQYPYKKLINTAIYETFYWSLEIKSHWRKKNQENLLQINDLETTFSSWLLFLVRGGLSQQKICSKSSRRKFYWKLPEKLGFEKALNAGRVLQAKML